MSEKRKKDSGAFYKNKKKASQVENSSKESRAGPET